MIDFDAVTGSGGNRVQVTFVRTDHEILTAEGTLDDTGIDDVAGAGAAGTTAIVPVLSSPCGAEMSSRYSGARGGARLRNVLARPIRPAKGKSGAQAASPVTG